jgi:hypothetical protein
MAGTFRESAEKRLGWDKEEFESRAFRSCLNSFPRLLVWLLWPWRSRLFAEDIAAMSQVAELTSYNDVFRFAQGLADARRDRKFFRDALGIRPRGRRLLSLARDVLPGRRSQEVQVETAYHPGATWRKLADVEPREAPVQKPAVPIAGPVPAPIPDDLGAPSSAQVESPALGVHAAIAARRKASGN